MIFQTTQIKGQGRGHGIGFPTINVEIPSDLVLDEGIYAAWVVIGQKTYKGALHYGSVPTFEQKDQTMEVHLLDVTDDTAPLVTNDPIEIDIVERMRDVRFFAEVTDLVEQIARDVANVRVILR